jgi:hypothetical protein
MANKKENTVYQRLSKVLDLSNSYEDVKFNKYNIDNKEILKTTSKEEYEAAKLQAQQSKYLKNTWRKVDGELFQKSLMYETTRIGSYTDFESMEFYPEIAAALDIFMEESTTVNDKGKMLNIFSDSKRIKGILEDLFYNRLDIHLSLPMWARNVAKYGDNFVLLNIDDKKGIIGGRQLPNFEIERHEGDIVETMLRGMNNNNEGDDKNRTTFIWRGRDIELKSWQIAHFRLLGDDRRLPYGTSLLEKARRIWKQLNLAEDAMLVYRITRAPERRVYKVFVGNIDEEDVPAYIEDIANRFKRTPIVDPKTGQVDLRYNTLSNEQDFFIPVRDENATTPIDTLPGAQNLNDIADISYLQRKLFTALRVPKQFLNFEESQGEGKNLALQDVRFSRTINRIQQALLSELNKIAIVHLYLLGFEDELTNFTMTLNNPSTQAEMLKVEQLQTKMSLFKDSVSDAGNGFAPMSMTRAKREILGWSDDEIKQDLLEQRMEKAAATELENTSEVIKHTGTFDKVDTLYGDIEIAKQGGVSDSEGDDEGGATDMGGGSFGGGGLDFGDDDIDIGDDLGGDEDVDSGEDIDIGDDIGGDEDTEIKDESYNGLFKMMDKSNKKKQIISEKPKIYDKSLKINESINNTINEIDKLIKE